MGWVCSQLSEGSEMSLINAVFGKTTFTEYASASIFLNQHFYISKKKKKAVSPLISGIVGFLWHSVLGRHYELRTRESSDQVRYVSIFKNPVEPWCHFWAIMWAISKHSGSLSSIPVNGQWLLVLSPGYLWEGRRCIYLMISCCSPKVVYQADSTKRIYCYTKLPLGVQSCRRCPIIWAVDFNSHCVLKAQQNNSGGGKSPLHT